jgi:hypothetical protein
MKTRRLFAIAVIAVATACGGDSTAPTVISVSGTWNLKSINGQNLPYVLAQTGQNKQELTADVISVVGSSFTQVTTVKTTVNGQVTTQTFSDAGSFTLNGTAVSFRFNSDNSTATGTVSGNTFTVAVEGFSYVYQK